MYIVGKQKSTLENKSQHSKRKVKFQAMHKICSANEHTPTNFGWVARTTGGAI